MSRLTREGWILVPAAWAWAAGATLLFWRGDEPLPWWLRAWVIGTWVFVSWRTARATGSTGGGRLFELVFAPAAVCVASLVGCRASQ